MQAELAAIMLFRHGANFDQDIQQEQAADPLVEQTRADILQPLQSAEEQVDAMYQQTLVRLDALALEPQHADSNDNKRRIEALCGQIATLDREIDAIDAANAVLIGNQAQQQQDSNQLQAESAELLAGINRVKIAINKHTMMQIRQNQSSLADQMDQYLQNFAQFAKLDKKILQKV